MVDGQLDLNSSREIGRKGFLSFNNLNEPGAYLENDTLTLRCRIWRNDVDLLTSVNCYAHTTVKVTKIDCLWTLEDFENQYNSNQNMEVQTYSTEIPYFTIHLFNGVIAGDDTIHFAIKQPQDNIKLILVCKIHLLDTDGKIAHSVQGEYLFRDSNEAPILNFPFLSKRTLLSKKQLYLPNGRLTLRCEFSASTGDLNNEIERFENGITEELKLKSTIQKQAPDLSNPWNENMQRLYNDGKFSDVTVCTLNRKKFPVHKAILCAHSEVFSAMFERDMKENRTGDVEIEDLENDTVSKMLMFLYTNSLEDLDFSMACKLYFAADKYQIMPLLKQCSTYLIRNLQTSNICDVLALADTHQDQELKSIAQDFIFLHDQEIIISEDWRKLMEAKGYLTSEMMQLIMCRKFYNSLKP